MNDERPPNWDKVSAALRDAGAAQRPTGEDLSAPLGFATKVVARHQANLRADATGLALWRRWALTGAACALIVYGGTFFIKPAELPAKPIIPVPTLDPETPYPTER